MSTTRRDLLRNLGAGAVAMRGGRLARRHSRPHGAASLKVIDVHGHYTTEPKGLRAWRELQVAAVKDPSKTPPKAMLNFSDDQMRESVQQQLKLQRERGTSVTIFSPRAAGMSHHLGNEATSVEWTLICNDLIHRICTLYPDSFIGVGQLPQSPGVLAEELHRRA